MSTVGVEPGTLSALTATVPTSITVPVETVPSGNSTSMVAPSANVSSPIGAEVVTSRAAVVSSSTMASPAGTVPSAIKEVPVNNPPGTTTKLPAGTVMSAASAVTPNDAHQRCTAAAVASSNSSSMTTVPSGSKPPATSIASSNLTSTPLSASVVRSRVSAGVVEASPSIATTGWPLCQKSTVPVVTGEPAAETAVIAPPSAPVAATR